MTRELAVLEATDRVARAVRMIEELDIRHLPVVDGRRLLGMVSDRDLRESRLPANEELRQLRNADRLLEIRVAEIMSREVVTIRDDATLIEASRKIVANKVGALPVLRGDELVGIVSYVDLLEALTPA